MLLYAFTGQIYFLLAISLFFRRRHIFFNPDDKSLGGINYLILSAFFRAVAYWVLIVPQLYPETESVFIASSHSLQIISTFCFFAFALNANIRSGGLSLVVQLPLLLVTGLLVWLNQQRITDRLFTEIFVGQFIHLLATFLVSYKVFQVYRNHY